MPNYLKKNAYAHYVDTLYFNLSMRGKKAPLLRGAVVGIGLGLYDNIIIHSVNNILILLSMINSVNVKKIDT